MRKNLGLNMLVIILTFILSGCYSIDTINYEYKEDTLVYSVEKIPESLISKTNTTDRENDIICALFEGLVELNKSGDPIPAICQGWKVSDNGLEYTFKLREDARWSSGEVITSFDFIDYFKYLFSPDNTQYNLEELYAIDGILEYKNGQCSFEEVEIEAVDNRTIVINLNSEDEDFIKKLAKPVYRLRDVSEPLSDYKNQYSNIRYTGAYTVKEISNSEILLEKNSYYVDGVNGIDKIKIKEQESVEADFASYNLGDIDILSQPPILSLKEGTVYSKVDIAPSNILKTLIFNNENNIISDSRFRNGLFNALYLEILDSYIIDNNIGTWCVNEIKYNNLLQKNLNLNEYYDESKKIQLKEDAKELLGKLDTRKKIVSIIAKNTSENRLVCEFISEILKESYNISSKITLLDKEELNVYLEKKNFDIYIDDLNLESFNMDNNYGLVNLEESINEEYSIVSLYYKNFMWCKSDNIDYLYIDGNGNLILKYTKG
ncbi:MAG: ABC transporter substrate-binding protein [Clostridium perfringens]|nr:ABC transporter substrate-binding protein [Clostridium perfringens]